MVSRGFINVLHTTALLHFRMNPLDVAGRRIVGMNGVEETPLNTLETLLETLETKTT